MSYQEDTIDWQAVAQIDAWLDSECSDDYITQPLAQDWARVCKVIEELGESVQALIGYTGANPRKGVTNTQVDMLGELADTTITAILAIQHFTKSSNETRLILRTKMDRVYRRMLATRRESPTFGSFVKEGNMVDEFTVPVPSVMEQYERLRRTRGEGAWTPLSKMLYKKPRNG